MHSLTIPETKAFIRFVALEQNEPVMLWGQFGVGKSELMAQIADETEDTVLCDVRLSQYDSVDLRGFPGVDKVTSLTTWYAPATLPFIGNPAFSNKGIIWLFLDEINAASSATAAVAYQLVNDHRVGEHLLRKNVRIVAAGNREIDRGVTNKQPLPLANRFVHAEVVVSVDDWCHYQQQKGVLPPIALAFYQFRKELLNTFDPSKPTIKTVSTPRTAEKAWKFWKANAPDAVKQAAMAGAIGDGPAAEAYAFADVWATLKDYIPRIMKDPTTAPIPKDEELAMRYAVTMALAGDMTVTNATTIHTYIKRLDPEFVALAWQFATKRDEALYATPAFMDYSKLYRDTFRR